MVWWIREGKSIEGAKHSLYRIDIIAIRIQNDNLRPTGRPVADAVCTGLVLLHDNAQPHVARVCRQILEERN